MTIFGTGFIAGTVVTFDGIPVTISAVTSTSITAIVPAHANGPVTVVAEGTALQVSGKNVECGPIQTTDAVIYVIDGVLEPPSIGGGCPTGSSVPGSSAPASSTPMSSSPSSSTPGDSVPC